MKMHKIVIGARGSKLSLVQANSIKNLILSNNSDLHIEIKTITTKGDKNLSPIPLDTIGKGWFTKELDAALINGTIDLAVHSLKDIAETLPEELMIIAIPEREDCRDVLISKEKKTLRELKKNSVIGTDSIRREIQVIKKRSDVIVKSIRGNISTRIKKLFEEEKYDAIVLAAAGLKRLGLENIISEYFDAKDFIPAPGQGALAVVIRKNDSNLSDLLKKINHDQAFLTAQTERTFSEIIGGGCKMPVGAYAYCRNNELTLYGMIGCPDGKNIAKGSITGPLRQGKQIAKQLAEDLYKKLNKPLLNKLILITRPKSQSLSFKKKIESLGAQVYIYPCIKITNIKDTGKIKKVLSNLSAYDWIIFTSVNGVSSFLRYMKHDTNSMQMLAGKKIAAVGIKTAEKIRSYHFTVHFIPSKFTTKQLGKEFIDIKNKKILLARSSLADDNLEKILKKKGAQVTNIPIYQTNLISDQDSSFEQLLLANTIDCITFASASSVKGYVKRINNRKLLEKSFRIPVVSIGPITAKIAKEQGFRKIYIAGEHTVDGIIEKLKYAFS